MPTVAVIPVKSFRDGKQRLAQHLDPQARGRLAKALATHVAVTVVATGIAPLVVTADDEVAAWATESGFTTLTDPGTGLDDAARAGVEFALRSNSPWIVLHSDLPLLSQGDVAALTQALDNGESPIAPSSDGGTSAIGGRETFDFAFGVASFHRHLPRMTSPQVIVRPGLALDVDGGNDLEAAIATKPGLRFRSVLE